MAWIPKLIGLLTKYWPMIQAIIAAISSIAVPATAHFQLQAARVEALAKGFAAPSDLTWWLYVPGQATAGVSVAAILAVLQSFNSAAHAALERERETQAKEVYLADLAKKCRQLPADDFLKVMGK